MAREKTEPGHEVKRLPLRNENGRLVAAPGIAVRMLPGLPPVMLRGRWLADALPEWWRHAPGQAVVLQPSRGSLRAGGGAMHAGTGPSACAPALAIHPNLALSDPTGEAAQGPPGSVIHLQREPQ